MIKLLISILLSTQVAEAGLVNKEMTRNKDGFTVSKSYKMSGNQCLEVVEIYKSTQDGMTNGPGSGLFQTDLINCQTTFRRIKEGCFAIDRLGNELQKVEDTKCNPGPLKDGWYVVATGLSGQNQITLQKGPLLFTGGKPAVVKLNYADSSDAEFCRVTLHNRAPNNRKLNPRILRLSDIQFRSEGELGFFSFNVLLEKAVDGQALELVKNITCSIKNGTKLKSGKSVNFNDVRTFKPDMITEIAEMFEMPFTKKQPTDI